MFIRNRGIATQPGWPFIGLVATALLLAACVVPSVPAPTPALAEPPPTATPEPATSTPEPPTPTPELPTSTPEPPTPTPEPPTPEPTTATSSGGGQSGATNFMDEIFPPGYERERDLVIYTCGSCHAWACAVIGQRPVEHWKTVQANHKDKASGLDDEEYTLLFDFLAENFNDTKPEPDLPEALRDQGCTTQ